MLFSLKESDGVNNEKVKNTKVLIRSVLILHEGANTRVRVDSDWPDGSGIKVEMNQRYVFSPFLIVVVIDGVTELERECFKRASVC